MAKVDIKYKEIFEAFPHDALTWDYLLIIDDEVARTIANALVDYADEDELAKALERKRGQVA